MNSTYIIYDQETGRITSEIRTSPDCLEPHVRNGESALQIDLDWQTHYINVETCEPVPLPERPSAQHTFNWNTKQWQPDADLAAASVRGQRAPLLLEADYTINRIEDDGGDASAWREHRKALRDVTAQPGFPFEIVWPARPEE